jgi:hypothetical protein
MNMSITQEFIARHESGHAVVARVFGCTVFAATAREGGGVTRHTRPDGTDEADALTRAIVIIAAGDAGTRDAWRGELPTILHPQPVILPDATKTREEFPTIEAVDAPLRDGTSVSDLEAIEGIARQLREMGESTMSGREWHRLGVEVASDILRRHQPEYERVAAVLVRDQMILTPENFEAVFHGREM